MESYSEVFRHAKDKLKVADYGVTKIFQMSRDPKVVCSAIHNLHEAQVRALDALLLFERTYKRVPAYPVGHLETKLRLFSEYCIKRYNLSEDMVKDIRQVALWEMEAKSKPSSLSSDSRLVFSEDGFPSSAVPVKSVREMVVRSGSFLEAVEKVVQHVGVD